MTGKRIQVAAMTRSEMMARVRGKDTKPELLVRKAMWTAGLRYRLHLRQLPGKPDLAFIGRRVVVFVHGCFWHGHEGCPHFRLPKTRVAWWTAKLGRNKARDSEVRQLLVARGWTVIVAWECETNRPSYLPTLVERILAMPTRRGWRVLPPAALPLGPIL